MLPEGALAPAGCALALIDETTAAHLLLKGIVDSGVEVQKLQKRKEETAK